MVLLMTATMLYWRLEGADIGLGNIIIKSGALILDARAPVVCGSQSVHLQVDGQFCLDDDSLTLPIGYSGDVWPVQPAPQCAH